MKLIVWNVRGLGLNKKKDLVKHFLDGNDVDIVVLTESKLNYVSEYTVRKLWGAQFTGFHYLPSNGSKGGILVMWKKSKVLVVLPRDSSHTCSLMVKEVGASSGWLLTAVYGPILDGEKILFMQEFRKLRSSLKCAWVILGDFNLMRFTTDKKGVVVCQTT